MYRGTSLIRKASSQKPAVGLCIGPYDGPRGGARSTVVATSNGGKKWEAIPDLVSEPTTLLGTL